MAVAEITLVPIGTQSTSCSQYVASVLDVLQAEEGIEFELNPMGTVISAPTLSKLYAVIEKMQEHLFDGEVQRLYTVIKIDDRRDKNYHFHDKITSVKEKRKPQK